LTFDTYVVNSVEKYYFFKENLMKRENYVQKIREERLMSKSELARLAGVSPATIDRIERGEDCRMETKRKIILALGFSLSEKEKIFID
jgi:DNA-binding XRE family transcriptional regulator